MDTPTPTSTSKYARRFDEEFKREAVALASRPGASVTQVARDLGVSQWSLARWKQLYGPGAKSPAGTPPAAAPVKAAAELERENRALRRENEELRLQREVLKKALAIFSEAPRRK